MGNIALIGGTIFLDLEVFPGASPVEAKNEFGPSFLYEKDGLFFLPRHGREKNIPPHRINHQANMKALKDRGVSQVVGASSVGSLKLDIKPGSLIVPDDYMNLSGERTCFNDSLVHITPRLSEGLRQQIFVAAGHLGISPIKSAVYAQTTGPRLETKAEVRFLGNFADLVGMTMGGEATAAQEMNLGYACICSVDNYAHGITEEPLTAEAITRSAQRNAEIIARLFLELVKVLRKDNEGDR
jgi:5'-methylthioadenosine phosphorylase